MANRIKRYSVAKVGRKEGCSRMTKYREKGQRRATCSPLLGLYVKNPVHLRSTM